MATKEKIYRLTDGIVQVDTGIVLGASVYKDRVSRIVNDRILSAVDLYKQKKIKKILVSADHGHKFYDEVSAISLWLRKYGIPQNDILMDHSGFSTYESVFRAKNIFHIHNAVIVTQEFHLPRAIYIAEKMGISTQGFCADRVTYEKIRWYQIREYLARIKDFFLIHVFKPESI